MNRKRALKTTLIAIICTTAWAQAPVQIIDQPDAQRTRQQLSNLLDRYPPALKGVLALDPALLTNQAYVAPYPALAGFLSTHPEVARNPSYYVGETNDRRFRGNTGVPEDRAFELWRDAMTGLTVFLGFGMAISLIVWLIRTVIDYRRWNKLAKVQAEVHTRILDRFTANEELLAYIQSSAGKRFLESSPIMLDEGPRSIGAPLGRILWSVQAGCVFGALGVALELVGTGFSDEAVLPFRVIGPIGMAIGIGFLASAGASYLISKRLGLIVPPPRPEAFPGHNA